jgi:hypothetical protein
MNKIILDKSKFYADYFWSVSDGSEVMEDVFVKTYLKNYFTFKDFINLYKMVGREKLLEYAKKLNIEKRIRHLIDIYEKYK